ncbi:hypothetical protein [Massilia eburnea]|uniref:hypothetical protein n=1 Tax=Massilia eburnea TaxID=1776165 RepID=UPI00147864A0|nr:hypothetical protein [Massilia eburnea]
MTLHELVERLADLSEDATLFVERIDGSFTPLSRAAQVVIPEEMTAKPIREVAAQLAPGLEYFLEVFIIREVLEDWIENTVGSRPSLEQALERVIYYAENDA